VTTAAVQGSGDTVVIIPALDEEGSIGRVLEEIPRQNIAEVIVVDNGSGDRTAEVAARAGATVLSEPRRGYGYACMTGIAHALKRNPAIIAFLDGDYSDFPEDLVGVLRPIREDGYDLVIGSRMLGEREPGAMLPQGILGNWLATTLMRFFWGARFTDLGPMRAIRREALQRLAMREPAYGWTVEMQINAARSGLRSTEIPVRYRRRIGESKVTGTLSGTVKAGTRILFVIFRSLLSPPRP
jgi:glycosyltransferase involved in cell wall biosynthesis